MSSACSGARRAAPGAARVGQRAQARRAAGGAPGLGDRAARRGRDFRPRTARRTTRTRAARPASGARWAEPGAWILGEDSGIEAAALGGRPGIESARWAEDGVAQLLAELDGAADRRARYVCELVALAPDGRELRGTGILEGAIADERRGNEGFGYDPIFVPAGEERTVAELGNAWKRSNSHRARAAAPCVQLDMS